MSWFFDKQVAALLERMTYAVEDLRFQLSRPGFLSIVLVSQKRISAMSTISFKVILPALIPDAANDVVSRELSVQIGDLPPDIRALPVDAIEADGYSGEQDSPVKIVLVDVDDAGNRSEPSTLDVVLVDTFAPAQPGTLAIMETGEIA